MLTLTSKQIKFLKSIAMQEKVLFQVGKEGIGENFISLIDNALEAREIVKFRILQNSSEDARTAGLDIASATNATLVQTVGKVITLYRPSKKKIIELPR